VALRIEGVIIDGAAFAPRQAEALRRALERELAAQLQRQLASAAGGGGRTIAADFGRDRIEAPALERADGADATGRAAARSLASAVAPLLTPARPRPGGRGGKHG
jgi:hypothetical protein